MTTADPKRIEDGQMVVPDFVVDTLARCLLPQLQAFYASPEGKAAFEEYKNQHLQEVNNYEQEKSTSN